MWTESGTSSNSTPLDGLSTTSSDFPGVFNPSYEQNLPVVPTWENVEAKAKDIFQGYKLKQFEKRRMREDKQYEEMVLKLRAEGVESDEERIARLATEREEFPQDAIDKWIEKKEFNEFMERAKFQWNCVKLGFFEDIPQVETDSSFAINRDLELDRLTPKEIQEEQIPDAILKIDRRRSI